MHTQTRPQASHPTPPNENKFDKIRARARLPKPIYRTDELTQAAADRAAALVEAYVPTPATEGDLRCIEERQLRHKAGSSSLSLGVPPSPCRHGFPQAFAFDPCGHKVRGSGGKWRAFCNVEWRLALVFQVENVVFSDSCP